MILKKKLLIILLIILTYKFGYSQNWDSIKKSNTVYIYFDHSEFQKVKEPDLNYEKFFGEIRQYEIKFDDENFINISDRKFYDFDSIDLNNEMERKYVKKSFLKENKNLIIDINFIKKYGLYNVYFLIFNKKKYLIDIQDFKRNKVLLKEIVFGYVSYTAEE